MEEGDERGYGVDGQGDELVVRQRCGHGACGGEVQGGVLLQAGFVWDRVVDAGEAEDVRIDGVLVGGVGAVGLDDAGEVVADDVGQLVGDEEAKVSSISVVGEDC